MLIKPIKMRLNFFKIFVFVLTLPFVALSQDKSELLQQTLQENTKQHQLSESDVSSWKLINHHTNEKTGIEFNYLHQTFNDVLIYNAISVVAVKEDLGILASNGFVSDLASKVQTSTATITPTAAIHAAANHLGLDNVGDLKLLSEKENNTFVFEANDLSVETIDVQLKLFKVNENSMRAAWDLHIYQLDQKHWWSLRVDAQTGEILDQTDWVVSCDFEKDNTHNHSHAGHQHTKSEFMFPMPPQQSFGNGAGYNVFPIPLESPNHGPRQLLIDPSDSIASPFGWHDTDGLTGSEYTTAQGNNVYASEDRADTDAFGHTPEGGSTLDFDFPLDFNLSPIDYQDAAITNLFYMNNIMHDVWYHYGFNEESGNFQENNYANGGFDDDYVNAQAQDGGGMNNANMATGPDGYNPRMQMYLWSSSSPDIMTVNSPSILSGTYDAEPASFGPPITTTPITANLALFEDATPDINDACSPAVNAAILNGKIVVVKRGNCNFTDKVENAENAGAIAVIVVNNGGNVISMGGTNPNIGIPSVMISATDGNTLIMQIQSGLAVNVTLQSPTGSFYKDGDFDNGIVAHEYGHGISTRLTGGASVSNCLYNEDQMGEGWSDWFALMLTIEPGDQAEDVRGIGTYATAEPVTGGGIRPMPYSTDLSVNNITFGATNNVNGISQPHGIGFVWATMLWDLNWALIDKYGFDSDVYYGTGGNNIAMQLVIDGLKLQPCSPGFVDGRDAILLADQLNNNGANECLIWKVFADRGLGFSAQQGNTDDRTDQVEAFDLPPNLVPSPNYAVVTACNSYTWPVNGQTYTGSGNYTHLEGSAGVCDALMSLDLTIQEINTNVTIADFGGTLEAPTGYQSYQWIDCSEGNVEIAGENNSTFEPSNNGSYAVIIGNGTCVDTSDCFTLNSVGLETNDFEDISVYPNPTEGKLMVNLPNKVNHATIRVVEMTGKVVQEMEIQNSSGFSFNLKGENGIYSIEVKTDNGDVYRKRISKLD